MTSDGIESPRETAVAPLAVVPWRGWGEAAFAEAARDSRPIFLTLQTSWCAWCRRLETETFADPRVVELLSEEIVPVRVDAERYPHVRDRYIGAGWPTNALLTPSGGVLWSGPFVEADALLTAARATLSAWRQSGPQLEAELERRRAAIDSARGRRAAGGMPRREAADDILTYLQDDFDDRNGGFGGEPKYPPVAAVEFLYLQASRLGAPAFGDMADRTLDGMLAGAMRAPETGAFHRYALAEDWTRPSSEHLLGVNAELARCYALGASYRGRADWAEAAESAVGWVEDALARGDGLYGGSVAAPPLPGLAPAAPEGARGRPRDATAFADANAAWARCLADAGVALGRSDWIERAADTVERVAQEFGVEEGLPSHFLSEDGQSGVGERLLVDAAEVLAALTAVASAAGSGALLRRAAEFARVLGAGLWSDEGGFLEFTGDTRGPLGPPDRPFHENATAARTLLALHALDGARGWRTQAEVILAFLSPVAARYGIDGAAFALATDEFFEPAPLVVLREEADAGEQPGAAARGVPGVRIWRLTEDVELRQRAFAADGPPEAWVWGGGSWAGPFSAGDDLRRRLVAER